MPKTPHRTDSTVVLNPSDKYELQEGDEVIVLAEDDDEYKLLVCR